MADLIIKSELSLAFKTLIDINYTNLDITMWVKKAIATRKTKKKWVDEEADKRFFVFKKV